MFALTEPPRVENLPMTRAAVRRFAPVAPRFPLDYKRRRIGGQSNARKSLRFGCGESPDGSTGRICGWESTASRGAPDRCPVLHCCYGNFRVRMLLCCSSRGSLSTIRKLWWIDLGYEPKSDIVSGYFNSETGNGQFTCMFYLKVKGKCENNLAKVESYFPGTENDRILEQLFAPAPTHLLISLKKEHGAPLATTRRSKGGARQCLPRQYLSNDTAALAFMIPPGLVT
jgi:hypothetical protein